jgi:alpha-L-rhamnosidase
VESDQSTGIEYGGPELTSRTCIWWTARAWDERDSPSPWSAPAHWTMGLLQADDWVARWIGRDELERPASLPARYLRREFQLDQSVRSATLHVSGLGFCEAFLNGSRVGDHRLDPALTNYHLRICYLTHEVGDLLVEGPNALGVVLGNGRFFAPRHVPAGQVRPRGPNPEDWFEPYTAIDYGFPKLLLQLELELADGQRQTVATDGTWRVTTNGPIRANNEYDGETYDARLELPGWDRAGFDDSGWEPVELVDPPPGVLCAQMVEPIRMLEELPPVSLKQTSERSWLVDLGQSIHGVQRAVVSGPRDSLVDVQGAYALRTDGRLRSEDNRTAETTDRLILAGGERVSWEPRFRGQGMRYLELRADTDVELHEISGRLLATDCRPVSDFQCSDPLLERLWRNVWWGHRNYKRSVGMEPDRDERQGWLGDPAKHSESDGYNFDVAAFYRKWLDDILLEQRPDGEIPEVAPAYWEAYHGDLVWPSVVTILPEWLHDFYNDRRVVERAYPTIVRWLAFVERSARADGTYDRSQYGDWCDATTIGLAGERPVGATSQPLIATAYHANNLRIAARFAAMLGLDGAAAGYRRRAAAVRDAFNRAFLDAEQGVYGNGTQTSFVLPLAFGLVPPEVRDRVICRFVDEIEVSCGGHLSVGLIGMQWLMQVLTAIDRADLALRIARQRTRPSWGYMIEHGATTIWERWDSDTQGPGMNSEALLILAGNLGSWFFQAVAGIELDASEPGWRRAWLRPRLVRELESAGGSIDTVAGRYESAWIRNAGELDWSVAVPPNATATAWLPTDRPDEALEGGLPLDRTAGVRVVGAAPGGLELRLDSGSYRFRAPVMPALQQGG